MKKLLMSHFIFISLLGVSSQALPNHKTHTKRKVASDAVVVPFESKEEIRFQSFKEALMVVPPHKSFYGFVQILNARHLANHKLMLFKISDKRPKLTDYYCDYMTKSILDIVPEVPVTVSKLTHIKTAFGSACHVTVKDEDPLNKEKHVIIFNVKGGALALVLRTPLGATEDEIYEFESFVKGLQ